MDVRSGVAVAVMMRTAGGAVPLADGQGIRAAKLRVLITAGRAELRRRKEPVHFHDTGSILPADVFQDAEKLSIAVVIRLLSVFFLHEVEVYRFDADDGIALAELVGEVPMIIAPLVRGLAVQAFQDLERTALVAGAVLLPLERTTGSPYLPKGVEKEHGYGDIVLGLFSHEHGFLVAKIEADALTRSGFHFGRFHVAAQIDVDVAELVPLDRYGLDGTLNAAAVVVSVLLPLDIDDAVLLVQLPASLLEREGLGLPNLAELGRMDLPLLLQAEEEELVALLYALGDIL